MAKDVFVILNLGSETEDYLKEVVKDSFPIYDLLSKPHLTLVYYPKINLKKLIRHTDEFMKTRQGLEIVLKVNRLEYLTLETVVCFPDFSSDLLKLYRDYTEKFKDKAEFYTTEDEWKPHITLYKGPAAQIIMNNLTENFRPFKVRLKKIELSVNNKGNFEIVYSKEF